MISKEEYKQKVASFINEDDINIYKKKKLQFKVAMSITLPVEFVIALIVAIVISSPMSFAPFVFFVVIGGVSFVIIYTTTRFKWDQYKEKYIYQILEFLLVDYKYEYDAKRYIQSSVFNASPFAAYYDHYSGEDLIKINIPNDDGTPSSTILSLCDLHITKTEEDADGDTHTVTVFNGIFGYIDFPFEFKCSLGINDYAHGKNMKKIKLEDIAFNKKFKIYTDNQMEALVILTPTMMKKLEDFQNRTKGFAIVLTGNKMYFHIYKDMLEMKRPKKEFTAEVFDDIYDDIHTILSVVEEIKTNNKVFKM